MTTAAAATSTRVALVLFDGFNELDSFMALGILNRLRPQGLSAEICGPLPRLTSMHGVTVDAQRPLESANEADVVLFGSGLYTRAVAENAALMDRLTLDPVRQLLGAQSSGALLLARLGLLGDRPACADHATKPWLMEAGVRVLNEAFHAHGSVATAAGCMAAPYLSAWIMGLRYGPVATESAVREVAQVGEADAYVASVQRRVQQFV
jgi:transcriptional regulator GlxA family with amidase domain